MKLLHTSDWHIGRQFHNVSLLEDQSFVLTQMIDIARREGVDAILVAGDIYDRSVPPASAVELLDQVVHQIIHQLKIPLIMIPGNHDSAQRLGFASRQLQQSGVYILGDLTDKPEPIVLKDAQGEVAFWGMPYADPAAVREAFNKGASDNKFNLEGAKTEGSALEADINVSKHDDAIGLLCRTYCNRFKPGQRNVVLSHCFIDGASESESERPLSMGGADRVNWQHFSEFDYVALGHLHGRQFKGEERIRYSGSIMKYSFSEERHIKSVTLVDLKAGGECDIEQVELKPLHNMRTLTGTLDTLLAQGADDPNCDDYVLVKLMDTHAILDVMGKIRAVYPNVLHLERPGLMANQQTMKQRADHKSVSEQVMFEDFFQQVMDRSLSKEESSCVQSVIEEINGKGDQV